MQLRSIERKQIFGGLALCLLMGWLGCSSQLPSPYVPHYCVEGARDCPEGYHCSNNACLRLGTPSREPEVDGGGREEKSVSEERREERSCEEGQQIDCYEGPLATRGQGVCAAGRQTCTGGAWGPCVGQVLPGPEDCDGKDNNCDGQIDEDLSKSCYSGDPSTEGKGNCMSGTQSCKDGKWTACEGEILPDPQDPEKCDGKDNNCDGNIDENCKCTPGQTQACGNDQGKCTQGRQTCNAAGAWGVCKGGIQPSPEVCDNIDNDCDGKVDEDFPGKGKDCSTGTGVCKSQGKSACKPDKTGLYCMAPAIQGKAEVCDGLDNNCNGTVDEGNPQGGGACSVPGKKGECSRGVRVCKEGKLVCPQKILPKSEVCDGKDNDCDGQTDEGLRSRPCYTGLPSTRGKGECKDGSQTCASGKWSTCTGQTTPRAELCDNKDNDCDGQTDEGNVCSGCNPGSTQSCGNNSTGLCKVGQQICKSNRQWGPCNGNVTPVSEKCDGKDNDCDGRTDESFPEQGQSCTVPGKHGVCAQGTYACTQGQLQCNSPFSPISELCDGIDNNCDGNIDENLKRPCYTGPSNTRRVGECRDGLQFCQAGTWGPCQGQVLPTPERCDGKDNDCNGRGDACRNGEKRCATGPTRVEMCSSTCQGWSQFKNCPSPFQCKGNQCCKCKPGAITCADTTTVHTCSSDCQILLVTQCSNNEECTAGKGCTSSCICTTGTMRCNANKRQQCVCKTWSTLETCVGGTCVMTPQGRAICVP